MLVRSYGFSVSAGNAEISLQKLLDSLVGTSGQPDQSLSNERRIFIDTTTSPDFALGLVVTVKDQKTFCELVNNKGNFVISVTGLKGTNKLMEFNFFVINKTNGLGIYQHYFQSCSPGTFGTYLRTRYRKLTDDSRDAVIDTLKAKGQHNDSREKAVRSKHAKGLNFAILVQQASLESILKKFKDIKGFEYQFATLEPELVKGAPIADYVNRLTQKVSFKPNIEVDVLAKAIQATVDMLKPKSGHVSVIDDIEGEDVPMSVRIAEIPEHFGEQEYDVVATKLNNLDTSKFASHKVVDELVTACSQTYKHMFMAKVKNKKP